VTSERIDEVEDLGEPTAIVVIGYAAVTGELDRRVGIRRSALVGCAGVPCGYLGAVIHEVGNGPLLMPV
jgi:hypothetical protein